VVWRICWGKDCEIGEHIGNLKATQCEHIGGKVGDWKRPPPPKHKKKKARHLECMLGPSRRLHEISLPKRLGHHFWPGLTPLAKNTLPIQCWAHLIFKKF